MSDQSPLERADNVREELVVRMRPHTPARDAMAFDLLPPGSLIVTPEDRDKGFRVLTPDEVMQVQESLMIYAYGHPGDPAYAKRSLSLLAGKGQT